MTRAAPRPSCSSRWRAACGAASSCARESWPADQAASTRSAAAAAASWSSWTDTASPRPQGRSRAPRQCCTPGRSPARCCSAPPRAGCCVRRPPQRSVRRRPRMQPRCVLSCSRHPRSSFAAAGCGSSGLPAVQRERKGGRGRLVSRAVQSGPQARPERAGRRAVGKRRTREALGSRGMPHLLLYQQPVLLQVRLDVLPRRGLILRFTPHELTYRLRLGL